MEPEFMELCKSLDREPVVPEPPFVVVVLEGGAGVVPEVEEIVPPLVPLEEPESLAGGAVFLAGAGLGFELLAGALLTLLLAGGELIPDDLAIGNSSRF